MPWGTAAAIIGGSALLGGIRGSQGTPGRQETTQRIVDPAGGQEVMAEQGVTKSYNDLQGLVNQGPGAQDIQAGLNSQRGFAQMLQQYSQGNYAPTAQDQQLAQQMLAPQQEAIRQQSVQAKQQYAQTAARSGRGPMDFTFQNKLNQQLGDMQMGLAAQQSQLAAQQPGQRLQYAGQLAQVQSGLASQAMANRQAIFNMGSQIQNNARNFRAGTASQVTSTPATGGGFFDALAGGLGGGLAGAGIANTMGFFGTKNTNDNNNNNNANGSYLGVNTAFGQQPQQRPASTLGLNYNFGRP